ncbi:MAG: putative flavoprotein [Acidimicrobiia bacterium]|nr:putative flavoprotein [Acidimicrobiia bacterium]
MFTTKVNEIAPDIFRLSTFIPDVGPTGLAFNQFLIRDAEPMLFHTGMRQLFPLVSEAVASLIPLNDLRWISFSHVEADECGAMNLFLAASPRAQVVHGPLACSVSLNDLADRPPHVIGENPLDIGAKRMRFLPTPHVPHNWESGLWFEETTGTLLVGDLFTAGGDGPALTDDDIIEPALLAEDIFHGTSMGPDLVPTLERLAALEPATLALMHGASYHGDGGAQLQRLAAAYAERSGVVLQH